jgi:hypothetical protein
LICCGNSNCIGPLTTAEKFDDAVAQWNTRATAAAQPVAPTPGDALGGWVSMSDASHTSSSPDMETALALEQKPPSMECKAMLESQFANCHKEIKQLREALAVAGAIMLRSVEGYASAEDEMRLFLEGRTSSHSPQTEGDQS